MNSVVAILTYRRWAVVAAFLESLRVAKLPYKTAVFEDCTNIDHSRDLLTTTGAKFVGVDHELEAEVWERPDCTVYMGRRNLGVTGNTNRALRWFMRQDAGHLCLCNDDLLAKGDFVKRYAEAHEFFKVGLWCFSDFTSEQYKCVEVRVKGRTAKLLMQLVGIMMSLTREVVDKIGYFDTEFARFGEEHSDFTYRARFSGFLQLNGQPQNGLDIPCPELVHQDVPSSILSFEKKALDQEAAEVMAAVSARYGYTSHYRPFRLSHYKLAGGYDGGGIPVRDLEALGYELVVDYDLHDAACTA